MCPSMQLSSFMASLVLSFPIRYWDLSSFANKDLRVLNATVGIVLALSGTTTTGRSCDLVEGGWRAEYVWLELHGSILEPNP